MALSFKVLALTGTLVGGGIAIPFYLKSGGGKSSSTKIQAQEQVNDEPRASEKSFSVEARSIEKVSCEVSEYSKAPTDIQDFASKKENKLNLYSFVSCTNPTVQGSEDSFFGKKWSGFFPQKVLSEELAYKDGESFSISATISVEEGGEGNVKVITFSNQNTSDVIKGEWDFESTSFNKQAITVSLEDMRETPNKVYLFVDEKNQ